jgi:hypothetical protein
MDHVVTNQIFLVLNVPLAIMGFYKYMSRYRLAILLFLWHFQMHHLLRNLMEV